MIIGETLILDDAEGFRRWLKENHRTKIEVWLIFHKKSSGQQTLTIAQAVEEALCFGWIQSRLRPLCAGQFIVRFSPRRPGSTWSLNNLARVRRLMAAGRMTAAGRAVLPPDFETKNSEA